MAVLAGPIESLTAFLLLTTTPSGGARAQEDTGKEATADPDAKSQAERILALRTLLDADQAWRERLEAEVQSVANAYGEVSDTFAAVSQRLSMARRSADDVPGGATEDELNALEVERSAARDRFDAIIQRRSALDRQLQVLKAKIEFEATVLENLVAGRSPITVLGPPPLGSEAPPGPDSAVPGVPPSPIPGLPALPGLESPPPESSTPPAEVVSENDELIVDRSVADAREQLRKAEKSLSMAEAELRLADYAIALFEEDLESARALRSAARDDESAAQSKLNAVQQELERARAVDAPDAEPNGRVAELVALESEARDLLTTARERVVRHDQRIESSRSVVESIRRSRELLVDRVEAARKEVSTAKRHFTFVKSPLAPHRLADWLLDNGIGILFTIILMIGFKWIANITSRRLIGRVIRSTRRGDEVASAERAETLGRVFRSTATIVILVTGLLAIFNQAGMDLTVLLGGATLLGAALAFGSQSLIKDYFSGFMILAENQYSVGNVIRVGSTAGVVEDVNLRMTVLRDLKGIVHFIPHGQVSTVSNLTYGWSRALFDIRVAYKEDVNRVMSELSSIGRELRSDDRFGSMILEDPEMLGVDDFGDSAVVIRFFIKTRPLMQWDVKREMLRRIKMRFDELGIEIPFPHRTVFHRSAVTSEPELPAPPDGGTPG